jgi:VanZ family protein
VVRSVRMRQKYKIYLVMIWMSIIFFFSHQNGIESSNLSGGFSGLLHDLLFTTIEIEVFDSYLRILAHFIVFMILGFLILNCFKNKTYRNIVISFIIGFGYALLDEYHQSFIPGRASEFFDVMVDSFGVIFGIIILLLIIKLRKSNLKFVIMVRNKYKRRNL